MYVDGPHGTGRLGFDSPPISTNLAVYHVSDEIVESWVSGLRGLFFCCGYVSAYVAEAR